LQAQRIKFVVQRFREVCSRHHADVGGNEYPIQKAGDERCVIRTQQAPGRMMAAQVVEGEIIQGQEESVAGCRSGWRRVGYMSGMVLDRGYRTRWRARGCDESSSDPARLASSPALTARMVVSSPS
jgi:hypothetical protein